MIGILFRDTRQFLHGWTWIVVILFYAQTYVVEFTIPANPWVTCAALGPLLTATGVLLLALPCAIQDKSQGVIELWRQSGRPMLAYVYAKCVAPVGWAMILTAINGLVLCLWSGPSADDAVRYAIGLLFTALSIVCGLQRHADRHGVDADSVRCLFLLRTWHHSPVHRDFAVRGLHDGAMFRNPLVRPFAIRLYVRCRITAYHTNT